MSTVWKDVVSGFINTRICESGEMNMHNKLIAHLLCICLNILFLSCKSCLLDCSLLHKVPSVAVGAQLRGFVIRSTKSDHAAQKAELDTKSFHHN